MDCAHLEFAADVNVIRHPDTGGFTAEVQIHCAGCGEQFRFLGLPAGVLNGRPTVNVMGLQLLAPIEPQGQPRLATRATFEMPKLPERA